MSNMPDVTKRQVSVRLAIELCHMVEKEFGRKEDTSKKVAYVRALEEATRNTVLSSGDYKKIAAEIKANEDKRKGIKA